MPVVSKTDWVEFVERQPQAHLLQTNAWGELKANFGWKVSYILGPENSTPGIGALVLLKRLPFGTHIAYIPKGPVGWAAAGEDDDRAWRGFVQEVDIACRQQKVVFLILEPDAWNSQLSNLLPGFQSGLQTIQPPRTIVINLRGDEAAILASMKQKTRYNVRLSQKKGVLVSPSSDIAAFHELILTTGKREAFGVHSLEYYQQAYQIFHGRGECELFLASYQDEILAGLMVFAHGKRAWYFYGASSDQHREFMASYLLQWEAMRWARQRGCEEYDLWGVPDEDESFLEANFSQRSDGLWGVYRFKRGFGGELRRAAGPYERVYRPALYRFYRLWLKVRKSGEE
jgi:peptidoglycan pentaglycine glycine transferase (the first glycine)